MTHKYIPEACTKSHDTVPQYIVDAIEMCVAHDPLASPADIVDEVCRRFPTDLARLIDTLDPKYRPQVLLHRGDERGIPTIWLLGWSKAQGTDIHDHGTSIVGINVLRGKVHERVFACPSDCPPPTAEGESMPCLVHSRDLRAGSSIALNAPYVHEVFGMAEEDEPRDISVHAYYPPLLEMTYFKYRLDRLYFDSKWEGACPS